MKLPLRGSAKYYGASAKAVAEVRTSTSGGVASVMARRILRSGGVVIGAAFDPFPIVRHVLITDERDIPRLKGSKYVESDIKRSLKDVAEIVRKGRGVLFIGLPCHVAALYSSLGQDFKNLYTIDLICHGKPPHKLFQHWVGCLQKKIKGKIVDYWFRSKNDCGWIDKQAYTHYVKTDDGKVFPVPTSDNWYARYFLGSVSFMEGCYRCPFAKLPRVGDITLGDFWGIEADVRFKPLLHNGVSFVSVQSEKGERLLRECQYDLEIFPVESDFAIQCCYHLTHHSQRPIYRTFLFKYVYLPDPIRRICDFVLFGIGAMVRKLFR